MSKDTAIPILAAGIIGLIFSLVYTRFWADSVAHIMGYPVAIFIFPAVFFAFLIMIEIAILPQLETKTILKTSWAWLVIGMLMSNASVLILIKWFIHHDGI